VHVTDEKICCYTVIPFVSYNFCVSCAFPLATFLCMTAADGKERNDDKMGFDIWY